MPIERVIPLVKPQGFRGVFSVQFRRSGAVRGRFPVQMVTTW
jgi:hypothetical protein